MFGELLFIWSGAGLCWWMIAWFLVARDRAKVRPAAAPAEVPRMLSIFKPLPPLDARGMAPFALGIESFMAELDAGSELLLGIHEADRAVTESFLARWRVKYPQARLKVVYRHEPDDVANPKIAWQRVLANRAEGELWLWSDADIVVPPGFLARARAEYAAANAALLTFPYAVRDLPAPAALYEALFVNTEFLPGVLLLREKGVVDFGLGAGLLFQRDDFHRRVDWDDLGAELADDFFLGQKLGPVQVSHQAVTTVVGSSTWREALLHDLRWTKTIRWNRPAGSLGRIVAMPVLGWLIYALCRPAEISGWEGLFIMMQADVIFALAICWQAGCALTWRNLPALEAWSLWRVVLWLAGWLPCAVFWSGKRWCAPRAVSQFARQREARM